MEVKGEAPEDGDEGRSWTFLSNHAHVLVCLVRDSKARLRDIAALVGITERGVFKIIDDLEEAGVITRTKEGRRNHYSIHVDAKLRHPLEANRTVGSLIDMVQEREEVRKRGKR